MMTSLFLSRLSALVLAIIYFSGCIVSPASTKWRAKSDALLVVQEKDAEKVYVVPGRKRVIYAGFALHSDSTAFQGDVTLARDVFRSINSEMPVLLLSNQLDHSDI